MARFTILLISCFPTVALFAAQPRDDNQVRCTSFAVVQKDTLGNVTHGMTDDGVKWVNKLLAKKYEDLCYSPSERGADLLFYLTVTPDTYHGTRIERDSTTSTNPVNATVYNPDGTSTQVSGTVQNTTTTSTAVPYSFEYGIFTLAIERKGRDGKIEVVRRFRQKGIFHTYAGIPLGGRGHHPAHAVIEDAIKWVSSGALTDPRFAPTTP